MSQTVKSIQPASPDAGIDTLGAAAFDHRMFETRVNDSASSGGTWAVVWPYLSIARPDHWFKNVFMLLGVILACFYHPEVLTWQSLGSVAWAIAATCVIASSNYVINEILDAPTDLHHPVKQNRPIPSGRVRLGIAYFQWLTLGAAGLGMAYAINWPFFFSGATLLAMGLLYNVPPARTKDLPYVDVLSESVNNPLRLLLGWFAVSQAEVPPVSLLVFYWMIGAFFMATKRFAEYRSIAHAGVAGAYRASFRFYDENRLLMSMFFYVAAAALFLGVFIIRYHLELILGVPLIAGFFSAYMHVALKPDSAAQSPEHLYRERRLMLYMALCVLVLTGLMFVRIPVLYELFNVAPSSAPVLWEI